MKTLTAYPSEQEALGYFRIFATPPGGYMREITLFRGAPVKIGSVNTQDPFTEVTAGVSLPQVTVFDAPGEGDLDWLVPDCDIDIAWQNVGDYDFNWRWEGYIASYSFSLSGSDSSFNIDLKGAFYGLDDYLAIPSFPKRPIPYEILIGQAFDQDEHPAHLGKFGILFPEDWDTRVPAFKDPRYLLALKPWGVGTGQLWTGFTSRSTGTWENLLTGHVQSLLSNMFDQGGTQWSIRNLGRRRPQLFLRKIPDAADDRIIEIHLGAPGVSMNASRDFTQRAGVIYGSGTDFAGINFSNIQVSPDGRETYYKPFAYSPRLWPRKHNPMFDSHLKPKETRITFDQGVDEVSAAAVAQARYQRFAEPGITGTITLTSDPRLSSGQLMPRLMIRGGQTIRINGLLGVREGVLAHLTAVSADFNALTTTLTFDTKYRDALTVQEVQARTRDALDPLHALQVGKYSNTINDLVLPWSYTAGSGIVPTAAKDFFAKIDDPNAQFPFEKWTKLWPPKNPKSKPYYIKLDPMNPNDSNQNWSAVKRDGHGTYAIPIRMSQAGTIRLSQLAAYDEDGNVLPVKFHYSVYGGMTLAVDSMPQFPGPRRIPGPDSHWVAGNPPSNPKYQHTYKQETAPDDKTIPPPMDNDIWIQTSNSAHSYYQAVMIPNPEFPKYLAAREVDGTVIPTTYQAPVKGSGKNMAHPFYEGAWESVAPNGLKWPWGSDANLPQEQPKIGWGTYYEPAGYWPGRFSKGATRTGLLSDDSPWGWDMSGDPNFNSDVKGGNKKDEYAGMLFVLIYCDDQGDKPVYFMGRFVRQEPGQS